MNGPQHSPPNVSIDDVILVDGEDHAIGHAAKLTAHELGLRHRAFSIFVRDSHDRLLLQQRAACKYHSAGLWTNSCCGHPRVGEDVNVAAQRRLAEELGFACDLEWLFTTHYRAEMANGLVEDEIVHVFGGSFDGEPQPDPDEVAAWRWASLEEIAADVDSAPDRYTAWFRIYRRDFLAQLRGWLDRSPR